MLSTRRVSFLLASCQHHRHVVIVVILIILLFPLLLFSGGAAKRRPCTGRKANDYSTTFFKTTKLLYDGSWASSDTAACHTRLYQAATVVALSG